MARVCELTGKKTSFGGNHKHRRGSSGGGGVWQHKAQNTNRTWKPNLRKVKLTINGRSRRVKISMKAYKKLKKMAEVQMAA
ncbi:MAG: 50S ribosomal protein L28 [Candidatus Dojkabacteria bacterium]